MLYPLRFNIFYPWGSGSAGMSLIERKGYSMFHLIEDNEYKQGLIKLKNEIKEKELELETAGGTLVWFKKK